MEQYVFYVAGFGALALLTAWLPMVLRAVPLSLPIFCVGIGALLALIPSVASIVPRPDRDLSLFEHATELVVVVSLVGAGLKIDRPIGLRRWAVTWRMLGLAMPLTILALTILAKAWLGLGVGAALLLASSLAPTDPVLASDVQVGAPSEEHEDEARFALTSEAGLNDGLAFPFVALAIAVAASGGLGHVALGHWFTLDVVWKIASGAIIGASIGAALGWLTFHVPNQSATLARTGDGFVALGAAALAYGLVQAIDGYGFVGVFAAAVALRSSHRDSDYHERMHGFVEELERLMMMVLLVCFGAALVSGHLLRGLTWPAVAFAMTALLLVRPLSGWLGTAGSGLGRGERAVVSFFGIRGLGTVYYLAYALGHARFDDHDLLWATASLTVVVSIVMHGVLVTPALGLLDRRRATSP